uniref:(northern house mosquito) hypothetical protein n=1 Tax=Culex pipiens TaxID=7175 RepID=A0A8D8E134_CULPI
MSREHGQGRRLHSGRIWKPYRRRLSLRSDGPVQAAPLEISSLLLNDASSPAINVHQVYQSVPGDSHHHPGRVPTAQQPAFRGRRTPAACQRISPAEYRRVHRRAGHRSRRDAIVPGARELHPGGAEEKETRPRPGERRNPRQQEPGSQQWPQRPLCSK